MKRLLATSALALLLATPAQAHGFWPGYAAGLATGFFAPYFAPPVVFAPPPVAYYAPGAPTVLVPAPAIPDPAIRFVQHGLNVLIGAGLNEDGIEGPETYQAICAFQAHNGLVVDGIAGTGTLAVIDSQLARLAPPPSPPPAKEPRP